MIVSHGQFFRDGDPRQTVRVSAQRSEDGGETVRVSVTHARLMCDVPMRPDEARQLVDLLNTALAQLGADEALEAAE